MVVRAAILAALLALSLGARIGVYEILGSLGAGGPAFVRGRVGVRELRRGLAEAKERTR